MKTFLFKLLIFGLVGFAVPIFLVAPVEAHLLKTDGQIGAILHIDPQDDPIVGEPAVFFFEFKDRSGKFNPNLCTCTIKIIKGTDEVFSKPLLESNSSPSLTSKSFTYTFPQKAVYKVVLEGKATQPDAFAPFTLTYDVRVSRESTTSENYSTGLYFLVVTGIITLVSFGFVLYDKLKPKPKKIL